MPQKSVVEGDHLDPTPATNMVAELRWAKGPRGRAKPPPKRAIRRGLGRLKPRGLALSMSIIKIDSLRHVAHHLCTFPLVVFFHSTIHYSGPYVSLIHPFSETPRKI